MAKVKVKLLTSRVDDKESWVAGDVIEVDAAEAKALLEGEYAEPVAATKAKRASKASSGDAETR
ncbi:MAG: hypothetical protein EBR82_79350 [Caulobacteraceae bacterium]|nr:hypothetical protein [Caulobacteraceae bacterium]